MDSVLLTTRATSTTPKKVDRRRFVFLQEYKSFVQVHWLLVCRSSNCPRHNNKFVYLVRGLESPVSNKQYSTPSMEMPRRANRHTRWWMIAYPCVLEIVQISPKDKSETLSSICLPRQAQKPATQQSQRDCFFWLPKETKTTFIKNK